MTKHEVLQKLMDRLHTGEDPKEVLFDLLLELDEWFSASSAPQATGGLRELVASWRKQIDHDPESQYHLALGACADELEAALAQSQVPATSGVVALPDSISKKRGPAIVKGCDGYKCLCCEGEPTPRHLRLRNTYYPLCENCIAELLAAPADPAPAGPQVRCSACGADLSNYPTSASAHVCATAGLGEALKGEE